GAGGAQRSVEPRLKAMVQEKKLAQNVRFLGHVADVSPYLLAADIFVLLSESEGMSNSLLEAMASGLPVIVSDNSGNRTLIKDGKNGLIVPYKDIQATAQALVTLLSQAGVARTCGQKARSNIERE